MKSIFFAILYAAVASAAEGANQSSLLTSTELRGEALMSAAAAEPGPRLREVNSAMLASLEAQAQIRRVELMLKSGPAQNGDLRVVQAGKPDPNQK